MKLKLAEKKIETGGVTTFIFEVENPITWIAGQFMKYTLVHENPDNRGVNRFFTIASAPFEGRPQISTRIDHEKGSSFKKALDNLPIGGELEAGGIEGDFIVEDLTKKYVFIAGGIGITPYHSILKQLDHDKTPVDVILLYANRTEEAAFKEELEQWTMDNAQLKITYVIDPQRIDEQIIKEKVIDINERIFYTSGPEPMVEAMEKLLTGMGIPMNRIKQDFFPGYAWP